MKNFARHGIAALYCLILLFSDALAYIVAVLLTYFTRSFANSLFGAISLQHDTQYFVYQFAYVYSIYLLITVYRGVYIKRIPFWKESLYLVKAVTLAFLVVLLAAFFGVGHYAGASWLMLFFLWSYFVFFVVAFRYILRRKLFCREIFSKRAIVVGDSEDIEKFVARLNKEYMAGLDIVGAVVPCDSFTQKIKSYKVLGSIKRVKDILIANNVEVIVFLAGQDKLKSVSKIMGDLQLMTLQILIVYEPASVSFSNAEVNQTLGTEMPYIVVNNSLKSSFNRFIKRTAELILCVIFLPFLIIVILVISAVIKATSHGPVFYFHKRVGRNGCIINVLKFRTMFSDADERLQKILARDSEKRREWETSFKIKDDPRITAVGKFLRKTSLDELPQIFNVITGDMSLIGPRPVVPYELETYYKDNAPYYLMVRPGITGLWQVSGRSNTGYDFRVAKDIWYVLNWSVWLDIVILMKTIVVVLRRDGAY